MHLGDFFQQPPVGGQKLYTTPDYEKAKVYEDTACALWRSFNTIIILNEATRFDKDPEWGEFCRLARKGQWHEKFIQLLKSRVLASGKIQWKDSVLQQSNFNLSQSLADSVSLQTTYVTPDNETRLAINNAYIAELSKSLPKGHYPIRIVAKFNGGLNDKSPADISKVMSLPDSRLNKLAPYIDIVPGGCRIKLFVLKLSRNADSSQPQH